ncbi:MAG: tyrosine-type recombinase/integrase [Lachnospiraceae bacterium]|nr:tyrosine-type recombinase/integrase [Lachnospiraceae bacterium]
MTQKINQTEMLLKFKKNMKTGEKSRATIEKYLRDTKQFLEELGEGSEITKDRVITYKQSLAERYAVTSANSKLAAVNCFLRTAGCEGCIVKSFKVQKNVFRAKERELTKEEYIRLVKTAQRRGKRQLGMLIQTICATGIRISELPYITVEALYTRRAVVSLKGKTRIVLLPAELCRELTAYVRAENIRSGSIFVTRNGKPLDRSNIFHSMKKLCEDAEVDRDKVFPHNLRHLFAVTYYKAEKDVCHLADILGHSSINTTRIYTIISCEEQEQQINGLGLLI